MNLHSDIRAFKELVAMAAYTLGHEQSHVEKDYWITKILHDIHDSEYAGKTYFKGGTSLYKAYGIIQRFSEDLDLFVYTGNPGPSKQAEKNLNRAVSKCITSVNSAIFREGLSEMGGNYRKLHFSYGNIFEATGLKEHLEVEISSTELSDKRNMFYPAESREIVSIIGAYLMELGEEELLRHYELMPFTIQCLSPKKTICDKISRLVRISYRDDYTEQLAKHVRDIYDLCELLHISEYQDYVSSCDFISDMCKVIKEDSMRKNAPSGKLLSEATIFKLPDEVLSIPVIKSAYSNDLRKLLFDKSKMPPLNDVSDALSWIHPSLVKVDEIIYRK